MNSRFARVKTDLLELDAEFAESMLQVLGAPTDPVAAVERRARELLSQYRSIVWEGDPTTFQFTYVSASVEAILGYPIRQWLEPDFWADTIVPRRPNCGSDVLRIGDGQGP